MRLNDKDYALFDYEDGHGCCGIPSDNPFRRGDVVIKHVDYTGEECNEIGVVLQVHDSDELRTDMFGNESICRLRIATNKEIQAHRNELLNS